MNKVKTVIRNFYQSKSIQVTVISLIKLVQSISTVKGFMQKLQPQTQQFFLFSTQTIQIIINDFFGFSSIKDEHILYLLSIPFTLLFTFLIIGLSKGFYYQIFCILGTIPFATIGFGLGFLPSFLSVILISIPVFFTVLGHIGEILINKIDYIVNNNSISNFMRIYWTVVKYIAIVLSVPYVIVNYSLEVMFSKSFSKTSEPIRSFLSKIDYTNFPIVNTFIVFVNAFSIAMLSLFFIIYDIPSLFVAEWIIVILVLLGLGAYLITKREKPEEEKAQKLSELNQEISTDDSTSFVPIKENENTPRFEIFIKNTVIDFYFLIAQALVQPTTTVIFTAYQSNLTWSIALFAILFSLVSPLLFMILFVRHSGEIKKKLWKEEYKFYLDNSGSVTANLVKTMKYSYEWFPAFELALRLVYSIVTNFSWSIPWVSPCFGSILMLFFFTSIVSINPFRYTSQFLTYAFETLVLFFVNIIGLLQTTNSISSGYFGTAFQVFLFLLIGISVVASVLCFIFIDEPRLEKETYKPGLIRGWNKNPDLIRRNLDGEIMKYLSLLCSIINLIGMILFYATIPVLRDFQYEGMHLI